MLGAMRLGVSLASERPMRYASRYHTGFTLMELLMVIALVGVLAGLVLPSAEPSVNDQLRATARILATDLAYARSLAVTNNSRYRVMFDVKRNRYILEHSGVNANLDLLPDSPFSRAAGPQRQIVVALDELPRLGVPVRLEAVLQDRESIAEVEFKPLGETTTAAEATIWLGAGGDARKRYIPVTVHPITGHAEGGSSTESGPAVRLRLVGASP